LHAASRAFLLLCSSRRQATASAVLSLFAFALQLSLAKRLILKIEVFIFYKIIALFIKRAAEQSKVAS